MTGISEIANQTDLSGMADTRIIAPVRCVDIPVGRVDVMHRVDYAIRAGVDGPKVTVDEIADAAVRCASHPYRWDGSVTPASIPLTDILAGIVERVGRCSIDLATWSVDSLQAAWLIEAVNTMPIRVMVDTLCRTKNPAEYGAVAARMPRDAIVSTDNHAKFAVITPKDRHYCPFVLLTSANLQVEPSSMEYYEFLSHKDTYEFYSGVFGRLFAAAKDQKIPSLGNATLSLEGLGIEVHEIDERRQAAADAIPLAVGEQHIVSYGSFDFHNLVISLCKQAKVRHEATPTATMAIWVATSASVNVMADFRDAGGCSFELVTDKYFASYKNLAVHHKTILARNVPMKTSRIHCKFATITAGDELYLVLSSANLTGNPRVECYSVFHLRKAHTHIHGAFSSILDKAK